MTPATVVFEIGTGSGLAGHDGGQTRRERVYACESVDLIAKTARRIVERNGLGNGITILAKPSHEVELGVDLPERADALLHEIFSSDLLSEGVLPAIEDAKQRLLHPQARVVPSASSVMIALVGGDDLGANLRVEDSFGFDLSDFNAITARQRWLYREDLATVLMSDELEAFRFDFQNEASFPPETKTIEITATTRGLCHGFIQVAPSSATGEGWFTKTIHRIEALSSRIGSGSSFGPPRR